MTKANQEILDGTGFPYDRPFRIASLGKRFRVVDAQGRTLDGLLTEDEAEVEARLQEYEAVAPALPLEQPKKGKAAE